jgi:hypothetical protein
VPQDRLDGLVVHAEVVKVGSKTAAEGVPAVPLANRSDNAPGEIVNSRTPVAKRVPGGGEPDSERSNQGSAAAFGRRKGDPGRDRAPPGSKGIRGRGSNGQARYNSELV